MDDLSFSAVELQSVLRAQNLKKATGPGGLIADIFKSGHQQRGGSILAIANKCLSLRYFPKQWKVTHVVAIRKRKRKITPIQRPTDRSVFFQSLER
ncbi:hypothetical protein EVAR_19841_1 [Eumeta japonica]|uniref:Uncharacterized protein n=1 Tax=Eumeta variegata TaxID=151549 RepID=A0A4C1US05_EUMVA|nr:hypothetical protein EVAR_19841_1 [Eumeta japonica]